MPTRASVWPAPHASADTRKAIGKDEHNRLKDVASAADKARTVDNTPTQRTPRTFDEVLMSMISASNLDALYVAAEFISDIEDNDSSAMLAAKFDELKAELELA